MEKRIYFKNLSGLRFLAATAVIFHHVEQYKFWAGIPNIWGNTSIDALGQKAVSFFFVLSGFLISYLLLEENKKTGEISIRDFYIRRVLRIWPVYYLVVILCLFVVPFVFDLSMLGVNLYDSKFTIKMILLFLVLPNLLRVYSPSIVGGNQLWSIGVEEQFYLIWPVLIRSFLKHLFTFLLVFIVLKLIITVGLGILLDLKGGLALSAIHRFWVLLKVEQMAIGAIGAGILFYRKQKLMDMLYHPVTQALSIAGLLFVAFVPTHHWLYSYGEAVVFLILIVNLSTNPKVKITLETPLLAKLGNISYGIYMYHTLCITVCLYTLTSFSLEQSNLVLFNLLLYTGSILMTLVVAHLSYEYMEKFFLTLKERFMIVKSGKESAQAHQMQEPLPGKK